MTYRCQKNPSQYDNCIYYTEQDLEPVDINIDTKSNNVLLNRKYIDPWDLENYVYIHK